MFSVAFLFSARLSTSAGGMVGGFFATNIGSTMPFGMDGWRFAFHLMAAVSLLTSGLVYYIATDPRPSAKVGHASLGLDQVLCPCGWSCCLNMKSYVAKGCDASHQTSDSAERKSCEHKPYLAYLKPEFLAALRC